MIRLTPYLNSPRGTGPGTDAPEKQAEALNRVISVLMQGIALHGLQYDDGAFRAFQDAVWKMRAGFDRVADGDSAMLLAGAVIRLLEEHNESAQAHLRARHNELADIVATVCETLLDATHAKPEMVLQVRRMVQEVSRAGSLHALNVVRGRFDNYMAEIRAKAQLPVAGGRSAQVSATVTDPVTGLPDAGGAIEALARVWQRRADQYVGLFALEYLETINLRFGFRTGDELLALLGQQAGKHFSQPDQLFRWRGPCLVALVERHAPEPFVSAELGRAIPPRLESAAMVREREALVRVSTSWSMIRLQDAISLDDVVARMNEFSGNRSRYVRQVSAGA